MDDLQAFACGVDVVEFSSVKHSVQQAGEHYLNRVYTETEQAYCGGDISKLAGRFAAKEAISKALGIGIRGVSLPEMEILNDSRGKPLVRLHGRAAKLANERGLVDWAVSLTYSSDFAIAFVLAKAS